MDFLTPEEENIFEAIIDGTIFLALDGIEITDELKNILYTPLENVKPNHHEQSKYLPINHINDYCKL